MAQGNGHHLNPVFRWDGVSFKMDAAVCRPQMAGYRCSIRPDLRPITAKTKTEVNLKKYFSFIFDYSPFSFLLNTTKILPGLPDEVRGFHLHKQ